MSVEVEAIREIQAHAEKIKNGLGKVHPGQPLEFSEACTDSDCIWQGDLGLVVRENVTEKALKAKGYKLAGNEWNGQLVPGQGKTEGERHCLSNPNGVKCYIPPNWNEESLDGPFMFLPNGGVVAHPVHGDVTIPAGFTVECIYQYQYDEEEKKARRARD